MIRSYLNSVIEVANDLLEGKAVGDIANVISYLYDAWLRQKTIYLIGNGGSAAIASHFTCDLVKLGVKAHCLTDNLALMTAITNDNGFDDLYVEQLKHIDAGDVLICISVHGGGVKRNYKEDDVWWSQNLLRATDYAKQCGARVISLVGFEGGFLRRKTYSDASIKIPNNSTPMVEGWFGLITHLICLVLSEYQPVKVCGSCQRVYKITALECPSCHSVRHSLSGGIVGNIEEVRRLE